MRVVAREPGVNLPDMWGAGLVVISVLLAARPARSITDAERETIRANYYRARSALVALDDATNGTPVLGAALDRVLSAVANWTASFLDEHPNASAAQVAKAVERLDPERPCAKTDDRCADDYHLTSTAVRLNGLPATTFAVAANYPRGGTFFIVAHADDGHFQVAWNIKDLARRHYQSRDEIGYWAWTERGWGDGPLRGTIGALPRAASGHARFYVDAVAAAAAGGTYMSQFSVWEWSGSEARPLFIESYQVSFDTAPVTIKDGIISIPTKGTYKSWMTCGSCPEPHVLRRLRVSADGVHDLGRIDAEPEVRCVDELWDRLIHGRPAEGLATPAVNAALAPIVQEIKRDAGLDLDNSLGMLEESKLSQEHGRRFLQIDADNLGGRILRFEIGSPGDVCLRTLQILPPVKPVPR
ncbi:MAG: hypothetical protein QOC81_980 [Thermoanaerobaculia bacterium]|jgi:hypothetical protein|nr:hypothetical protein [Thermoanaerobaculia bacterium]